MLIHVHVVHDLVIFITFPGMIYRIPYVVSCRSVDIRNDISTILYFHISHVCSLCLRPFAWYNYFDLVVFVRWNEVYHSFIMHLVIHPLNNGFVRKTANVN